MGMQKIRPFLDRFETPDMTETKFGAVDYVRYRWTPVPNFMQIRLLKFFWQMGKILAKLFYL